MTTDTDFGPKESHNNRLKESELSPELREELRQARRCFVSLDRLTSLMMSYPPGHPIIAEASDNSRQTFREFFELNDRLSVMVFSHSMKMLGTDCTVWETEEPRDYCWMLSRDGVYLVHLLAGLDSEEIRGFIHILNQLVDERDLTRDAVSILFEHGFRYISYDAIDESMAQLADLDLDIRDRDTKEEQEAIEELFEEAFDKERKEKMTPEEAARKHQEEFQVRMEKRSQRQKRMEMGSREFLMLTEEQQRHLTDLRRGFTEHGELEHREGEILAAILGAHPKPKLRDLSIEQIGEVMGGLLETDQPWEALEFLKLIHQWRDQFDDTTSELLKQVVQECFSTRRIQRMLKLVASNDTRSRRSILQMFNALHLEDASYELARMIAWDLEDEVMTDITRFLRERSRYGLGFIKDAIFELPPDKVFPLLEIARVHLPRSRPIFLQLLKNPSEPELKAIAVQSLAGHIEPDEARRYLSPLLRASSDDVRMAAIRGLADAAPEEIPRAFGPLFTDKLRDKPAEEVRELANLFIRHGGPSAVAKVKSLIQVRGMLVGEEKRDLAITLAKILARNANPQIIAILVETAKDWRVNGKVRTACKELADILNR